MAETVAVRERPILFSGEMVRAILEGRKAQTRRAFRNSWGDDATRFETGIFHPTVIRWGHEEPGDPVFGAWTPDGEWAVKSPFGGPGERLWVRESHYVESAGYQDGTGRRILYRATEPDAPTTWTPSIHMPRWASRLTLEVTAVRVERLQCMSRNDANAEGIPLCSHCRGYDRADGCLAGSEPSGCVADFRKLWDSLNAKRGYAWETDPLVWVISFHKLSELPHHSKEKNT